MRKRECPECRKHWCVWLHEVRAKGGDGFVCAECGAMLRVCNHSPVGFRLMDEADVAELHPALRAVVKRVSERRRAARRSSLN